MSEETVAIKKIRSAGPMKQLMGSYFGEIAEAVKTGNRKLAWCTSVGPAELLRSFGFLVYFPENHGAMLGSSRMASEVIPAATAAGYSPDICSYLTSDVGAYLNKKTPLAAFGFDNVPKPDVLVYNTNQCRDVQDWFGFYEREWGVPMIGIETPRSVVELDDGIVDGLVAQHKALVPRLEEISGVAFDMDRLRATVECSYRCTLAWKKVLRLAEHKPSPLTFFDATIHMAPAVVLRGDERAVTYYNEVLIPELEERIAQGIGAVDDEAYRFYWEGMPVWGKLKDHALQFAGHRACMVASTYCNSWIFEGLAADDPFEGMARAYTELFIVRSEGYKQEYLRGMIEDYDIDGIIFHDAKTCPNNSNNRYGLPQRIRSQLGTPFVTIDGDLNDLRLYSEEQARTQFEALVEQLQESRG